MPPIELRAAGVSLAWNEIRRQWQLPFAILATNASSRLTQSVSPSLQLLRNLPTRRKNHSSHHDLRATLLRPELQTEHNIYPGSLHATLEAHRSANRSRPQYKYGQNEDEEQEPKRIIFRHSKKAIAGLRHKASGGENAKQQKRGDGVGPSQKYRPHASSPVSRGQRPRAPAVTWQESVDQLRPMQEYRSYASLPTSISYEGVSQQPRNEWDMSKGDLRGRDVRPWLSHFDRSNRGLEDVQAYLTAEILAFEKYMESTAAERAAVEQALKDVRTTIATFDPAIKISVVGSRSTGLAMPLSDIDVNIHDPKILSSKREGLDPDHIPISKVDNKAKVLDLLTHIRRKLKKRGGPSPVFVSPLLIEAKVPIVSARHIATNLDVQINCTPAGHASTELVKAYLDEFPTLRPLFFVLRQILTMRSLGDAASHGIGSYALLMMIVASLKFSATRFHPSDAGRQLLYFLDFYSKIDFRTTGIAVDPPELFAKTHHKTQARRIHGTADVQGDNPADETAIAQAQNSDQHATNDDANANAKEKAIILQDDRAFSDPVVLARKQISLIHRSRDYLMCLQDPANPYNDLGSKAAAIKHVKATFATLATKMRTAMDLFEDRDAERYPPFSLLNPCLEGNYQRFEKKRQLLNRIGEKMTVRPVVAKYL
jgi:DNA polymerase sigma